MGPVPGTACGEEECASAMEMLKRRHYCGCFPDDLCYCHQSEQSWVSARVYRCVFVKGQTKKTLETQKPPVS